jgi:branched-subunit amino acid aminotransferase/4-amino-4-deoxychorismate lyase
MNANDDPIEEHVWCRGEIIPLGELAVPVTDRVFEHGLGLFETMRGQDGRVPMWNLHRNRLIASALALGLKVDESRLPGQGDFAALLKANRRGPFSRLRLVLTGGTAESPGHVFVTARRLFELNITGLKLADRFWPVDPRDELVRHKSLNYWARRIAHEQAVASGADDALSQAPDGTLWESARATLFLVEGGRWFAPPADGPMLTSIAAGEVERLLSLPGGPGLTRQPVTVERLAAADEVILANAAYGPMSVGAWRDRTYDRLGPAFMALVELWRKAWF